MELATLDLLKSVSYLCHHMQITPHAIHHQMPLAEHISMTSKSCNRQRKNEAVAWALQLDTDWSQGEAPLTGERARTASAAGKGNRGVLEGRPCLESWEPVFIRHCTAHLQK